MSSSSRPGFGTRRTTFGCAVIACLWAVGAGPAQAQFTYLNQVAGGPVNSPGYIPLPSIVSNVGPDGQILVDEGFFGNSELLKAYSADGNYLQTLANVNQTINTPEFSAIGPDGTYYVSGNSNIGVFSSTGTFQRYLLSTDGRFNPLGVAVNSTGSLYLANSSQIDVYSTTFNGTNYPLLGTIGSAGTGPGQFGGSGVSAITLDPTGANVYAADASGNRIEVFSAGGTYQSSIGDASGPGHLNQISGVGVSGTGLLYAADSASGIKVFSSSGTYLQTVATTVNGQSFLPFSVSIAPTGLVYAAGQIGAGAGAFRFFDPASWSSGTNTFTNAAAGPTSVTVGFGQMMGGQLTLDANKGLAVGQTTTVNNSGVLTLAGGTLSTNNLVVDGTSSSASFTMTGGTLTANNITVSGGGVADFVGPPLSVNLNGLVSVTDATSQFKVEQGTTFTAAALNNNGNVVLGNNANFVVLSNSFNLGTATLNGGELDIRGLFGNGPAGLIQGAGTLSTTSGLSNNGTIQFTGQSSVMGVVNNLSNGVIEVSGGQSHTFFGGVSNDGLIKIDPGSSATFQGNFTGAHGTSGTGTVTFAGGLSPGDPVSLSFGGNVVLQHSNVTLMNLASATPGTGYDQINVAGQLSLDGTLQLLLQNFTPQVGQSFHLFNWGTETGLFSQLTLPALPAGESWNASHLNTDGTISVTISGDVNGDGIVNGQDLALVSSNYLHTGTGQSGDVNNDGIVNGQDLALVSSNWLHSAPAMSATVSTPVPEPATAVLVLFSIAGLAIARLRLFGR